MNEQNVVCRGVGGFVGEGNVAGGGIGTAGTRVGIVNLCDLWRPHAQPAPPSPKD